jgi:hypothetical protein
LGALDLDALLEAFLAFWLQHGEPLLKSAPYAEIAPHLVMMAFLDRVANGGGTLDREYAIGRDRMDLCLRYREITLGIEIKVWRSGRPDPLAKGLTQLDGYLERLNQTFGWLVIFDHRADIPELEERLVTVRLSSWYTKLASLGFSKKCWNGSISACTASKELLEGNGKDTLPFVVSR